MQIPTNTVWETSATRQLTEVLVAIGNTQTMQDFLRDVMTEKEITEVSARLQAAQMLAAGKKYTEIIEKTKLSSRTIARIREWMQNGQGGYKAALAITNTHHNHIPPVRAE